MAAHGKRSGSTRMDSSNLVFRRPNSLIFSYPKGKKALDYILSSPYKRFRSPNSFNFPLLTRMVQGKLKSNFQKIVKLKRNLRFDDFFRFLQSKIFCPELDWTPSQCLKIVKKKSHSTLRAKRATFTF